MEDLASRTCLSLASSHGSTEEARLRSKPVMEEAASGSSSRPPVLVLPTPVPELRPALVIQTAAATSEGSGHNMNALAMDLKPYSCHFCSKKFSTSQALGGHQNAHRYERAIKKNRLAMHRSLFGSYSSYSPGENGLARPGQLLFRSFLRDRFDSGSTLWTTSLGSPANCSNYQSFQRSFPAIFPPPATMVRRFEEYFPVHDSAGSSEFQQTGSPSLDLTLGLPSNIPTGESTKQPFSDSHPVDSPGLDLTLGL